MNDFEVIQFENGKEHVKRYTMEDLNYCVKVTQGKIESFIKKYGCEPYYIKAPVWFMGFASVLAYSDDVFDISKFCGLIICETPSIDSLDEIEVF